VADKVALGEVLFEYVRFLLSESWSFGGKQCFIINHNICEILLVINVTMHYATYWKEEEEEKKKYIYITPTLKAYLYATLTRLMVTYGAEPWHLSNTMESLNDMWKENIEKNIWTNIYKWLLENKNQSRNF
jgi:hypothetical protein